MRNTPAEIVVVELQLIELLQVGDFLGNGSIQAVVGDIQEAQLCEIKNEKGYFPYQIAGGQVEGVEFLQTHEFLVNCARSKGILCKVEGGELW